jgi:hypothetical protein
MGQETGKKGAGAVDLQPTIPKSDRLLAILIQQDYKFAAVLRSVSCFCHLGQLWNCLAFS